MVPRHYMSQEGIAAVNAAGKRLCALLRAARDSKHCEKVRATLQQFAPVGEVSNALDAIPPGYYCEPPQAMKLRGKPGYLLTIKPAERCLGGEVCSYANHQSPGCQSVCVKYG